MTETWIAELRNAKPLSFFQTGKLYVCDTSFLAENTSSGEFVEFSGFGFHPLLFVRFSERKHVNDKYRYLIFLWGEQTYYVLMDVARYWRLLEHSDEIQS